ncbi:MAG: YggS family pyridoxal phosphate-dependent enzyme [Rhodoferax sp.]|nr:YggS family pyridoxal phosphate-dependent enzyme [Betaproteobacteria bacterium]NCN97796.1 YggS family pyridoxal phosphate-dependent enzyme [Rhodoferax sp.]OIP16145.1 MAG: YggS family pyridoxal phosphate enzyme [Comamonadaceae bacterium CG2_30_57_122]PIZ23589.1 MAG: YggS family pyridoxal phosphate-dependent enzyme [Comamonadaceae bacterium CG_4_10_14_0_8_um_filter_57_29]PJC17929.1 MAG: YggS family pyridoxal phosphate-dependent enzyme [Comamonadaceae bacterium CG_4_9_14_0_8_um_filter_57_21]
MTMIQDQIEAVHTRMLQACMTVGRPASAVSLLAVSKTFGPDAVRAAHQAGQLAFGENYIQEAVEKITALRDLPLQWHCIGPIQSNKTRLVAEHFDWVQTVDRLKVAQRLSAQRPAHLPPLLVCIQVNVDGGPSKSGVPPEDALALARAVAALPHLQLRGLMCIPEPTPDFVAACTVFERARGLFDALNQQGFKLDTLSMGMSADLEAAIASGSTLVRVGSAIFGHRTYPDGH